MSSMGYQGIVFIKNSPDEVTQGEIKTFLLTNLSTSGTKPRIDSEGLYNATDANKAVGRVHYYDFDELTGSMDFDLSKDLIDFLFSEEDPIIKGKGGWVRNRQYWRPVAIFYEGEDDLISDKMSWNDISITCSNGSLITCSISFEIFPKILPIEKFTTNNPAYKLLAANNYINDKFGSETSKATGYFDRTIIIRPTPRETVTLSENEHLSNTNPLPYWISRLEFEYNDDYESPGYIPEDYLLISNWSLTITQEKIKYKLCSGEGRTSTEDSSSPHPGPKYLHSGVANVEFTMDVHIKNTSKSSDATYPKKILLPEKYKELKIIFEELDENSNSKGFKRTLSVYNIERQSKDDSITQGDPRVIPLKYEGFWEIPYLTEVVD